MKENLNYDEKLTWSRFNGVFNVLVGFPKEKYDNVIRTVFYNHPHFVVFDIFDIEKVFNDIGKPSLCNAYRKEVPKILDEEGVQHHLLNTGIETFDLNLYIAK